MDMVLSYMKIVDAEREERFEKALDFVEDQLQKGGFMAQAGQLSALPQAAEIVNPLFDALEQGDYLYAADLLLYETQDKKI